MIRLAVRGWHTQTSYDIYIALTIHNREHDVPFSVCGYATGTQQVMITITFMTPPHGLSMSIRARFCCLCVCRSIFSPLYLMHGACKLHASIARELRVKTQQWPVAKHNSGNNYVIAPRIVCICAGWCVCVRVCIDKQKQQQQPNKKLTTVSFAFFRTVHWNHFRMAHAWNTSCSNVCAVNIRFQAGALNPMRAYVSACVYLYA